MGQIIQSFAPPKAANFPLNVQAGNTIGPIQTVEVDNGSNLTLSVYGDGTLIRTLTPYVSRWNINTAGGWSQITVSANNAAIQATDQVTVICYDQVVPVLFPPSFGVSAWGAGATPNNLVGITPGNSLLAWQVQQFVNLLTGVMTGQPVSINNEILSIGSIAGVRVYDRDQVGNDYFEWYTNLSSARLFSSVHNGDVFSVDESGDVTAQGNIVALGILSAVAQVFCNGAFVGQTQAAAPSTIGNAGQVYVDTSGNLKYKSPAGTITIVVAGP